MCVVCVLCVCVCVLCVFYVFFVFVVFVVCGVWCGVEAPHNNHLILPISCLRVGRTARSRSLFISSNLEENPGGNRR